MSYRKGVLDLVSLVRRYRNGEQREYRSTEGISRTGAYSFRFLAQPVAGNAGA